MRWIISLVTLLLLGSSRTSVAVPVHQGQRQATVAIVPGKRIGSVNLGAHDGTLKWLGSESSSDAGMMHVWYTWLHAKIAPGTSRCGARMDVFLTPTAGGDGTQKQVDEIRTTSSLYRTRNGIHVGSSLHSILRAFPCVRPTGAVIKQRGKHRARYYDDVKAGIAFEVEENHGKWADGTCVSIIVHPKGRTWDQTYLPVPQS